MAKNKPTIAIQTFVDNKRSRRMRILKAQHLLHSTLTQVYLTDADAHQLTVKTRFQSNSFTRYKKLMTLKFHSQSNKTNLFIGDRESESRTKNTQNGNFNATITAAPLAADNVILFGSSFILFLIR